MRSFVPRRSAGLPGSCAPIWRRSPDAQEGAECGGLPSSQAARPGSRARRGLPVPSGLMGH
jgi:hypothetical protein